MPLLSGNLLLSLLSLTGTSQLDSSVLRPTQTPSWKEAAMGDSLTEAPCLSSLGLLSLLWLMGEVCAPPGIILGL